MLLEVEIEPLLALVAGLRDKPGIAVDQPDLDGLRRQRRRQARGGAHQQDDKFAEHRDLPHSPCHLTTSPTHKRRILCQKVRISAQRKLRIRANTTATEKIAIEPHLAHFTQAYRARPNDNAPTLTNNRTASAWRTCIRRSSDKAIEPDVGAPLLLQGPIVSDGRCSPRPRICPDHRAGIGS